MCVIHEEAYVWQSSMNSNSVTKTVVLLLFIFTSRHPEVRTVRFIASSYCFSYNVCAHLGSCGLLCGIFPERPDPWACRLLLLLMAVPLGRV